MSARQIGGMGNDTLIAANTSTIIAPAGIPHVLLWVLITLSALERVRCRHAGSAQGPAAGLDHQYSARHDRVARGGAGKIDRVARREILDWRCAERSPGQGGRYGVPVLRRHRERDDPQRAVASRLSWVDSRSM